MKLNNEHPDGQAADVHVHSGCDVLNKCPIENSVRQGFLVNLRVSLDRLSTDRYFTLGRNLK